LGMLALASRPAPRPRVPLADGSFLTLEAVAYGTGESVVGSGLQRFLHSVLPPGQKDRAGASVYRGVTPGRLSVWVRRPGPQYPYGELQATLFDEHGCESPSVPVGFSGSEHERWEFPVFPRRGGTLGLRLYRRLTDTPTADPSAGAGWSRLGEISAPHPAPAAYPRWEAVPQPVPSGELQVAVTRLETGVDPHLGAMQRGPAETYCAATLRITRGGKPAPDWSAGLHSISDATGNTWNVGHSASTTDGRSTRVTFPSCPWPDEDVWKLRLQLTRNYRASFSPRELWSVRGIPIPARGQTVPLANKATVNGAGLELVSVLGPGARLPVGFQFSGHERSPVLLLRIDEPVPDDLVRTIVTARDERGRKVQLSFAASRTDSRESRELLRIEAPPGARSLDLTYAVHSRRYVEVLARKTPASPPGRQ